MAKKHKPGPGPCVHCLRAVEKRTWDHLFPVSWYPDTTPPNLERWKFPACEPCNAEYGKLEQDILLCAGLCLDPENPHARGVVERVRRSITPDLAKGEKDRRAREACLSSLRERMFPIGPEHRNSLLSGFGPHPGAEPEMGIGVLATSLERFVVKIARGLTYLRAGELLLGPEYEVKVFHDPQQGAIYDPPLRKFGQNDELGPGISVSHDAARSDQRASLFSVCFWGTWRMWGVVLPRNHEAHPAA
jgi:hypothetical protein